MNVTPGPRLAKFIKRLRNRQARDYDNIIVIDGEEGSGKSNNGLYLCRLLDRDFNVEEVVYDYEDFERVLTSQRRKTIMIDEGGNLGFSRDFNVSENKEFVKFLMVCRQQNYNLVFCIPNFNWLDKYFREHRARYWLHMTNRDQATLLHRVRDWKNNQTRWIEDFRYRPVNVRKVWPDYWRVYHSQKRADFLGHSDANPSQSRQDEPAPAVSGAQNGTPQPDRPSVAEAIRQALAGLGVKPSDLDHA